MQAAVRTVSLRDKTGKNSPQRNPRYYKNASDFQNGAAIKNKKRVMLNYSLAINTKVLVLIGCTGSLPMHSTASFFFNCPEKIFYLFHNVILSLVV